MSGRMITVTTGTFFWTFIPDRSLKVVWQTHNNSLRHSKSQTWRYGYSGRVPRQRRALAWPWHWQISGWSRVGGVGSMPRITVWTFSRKGFWISTVTRRLVYLPPIRGFRIPETLKRGTLPF